MHIINILYFFLELIHPEILFQIIFNYTDNEVVEYKVKRIFNKKPGRYLIK